MELPEYFYPYELPSIDNIVFANIVDHDEIGLTCTLPEFNNREAFCALSNFSRDETIKRNEQTAYFEVLESTDEIIELSRLGLRKDNLTTAQENFKFSTKMYNFFKKWSLKLNKDLITTVLWKNYSDEMPYYSGLIKNTEWLNEINNDKLEEYFSSEFIEKKKFFIVFQMLITDKDGVDIINNIYNKVVECSTDDVELDIIYHAQNLTIGTKYTLSTDSTHESAKEVLEKAIKIIEEIALKYGRFKVVYDSTV